MSSLCRFHAYTSQFFATLTPVTLSSCPPIFAVFFIFSLGLSFNVVIYLFDSLVSFNRVAYRVPGRELLTGTWPVTTPLKKIYLPPLITIKGLQILKEGWKGS